MRRLLPTVALVALAAVVAAQPPAAGGLVTHRDSFSGREPIWVAADSNVRTSELDHRIVQDRYYTAPSSEYLKITAQPMPGATADSEFAYYAYDTPPAAVTEATFARVTVRSFRPGVRLYARVVLPKERDPKNPDVPLTALVPGEAYPDDKVRYWHPLRLTDPATALRKQLPVLTAKLGHQADDAGAYIDRLVLNVYAGPGNNEVWIDDLEIGPCRLDPARPVGRPVSRTKPVSHPYAVEFAGGKLLIDKKPFFMRGVRVTDTGSEGLQRLREAKFNTVFLPADTDPAVIEEAVTKHQFLIVPETPLVSDRQPVSTGSLEREADRIADHVRKFRGGDGVLMWDLGGGRTAEQREVVARTADLLRDLDPRRPRGIDLWDGYQHYSENLDAIGTHRWPLFTSLELDKYRDWLVQRKALTAPGKMRWTWVQTHTPDWYVSLAKGDERSRDLSPPLPKGEGAGGRGFGAQPNPPTPFPQREGGAENNGHTLHSPLGPTPEQIRILAYLGLASGCRGLGFWSDRSLANSHFGRDRLLELFLLNCEMDLLEPVLFAVQDEKTEWVDTNHGSVKAAVLRGQKGIIVLPVWVGPGTQHVPPQGALSELRIKVEQVPDGADPWLLTPATYTNLRNTGGVKEVPPGVEIVIPQFDLTAAVVFTNDTSANGLVVRWQENIRNQFAPTAARYAREIAVEEYNKVLAIHEQLRGVAPDVVGAEELLKESHRLLRQSDLYLANGQPDKAYTEARKATRPLRVLMRDHWQNAVGGLDAPTASPYAVSYFTLPQHWELAKRIQGAKFGANVLANGGFELSGEMPKAGAAVQSLPGWTVKQTTLDAVGMRAAIDPVSASEIKPIEPPPPIVPAGTRLIPPPARVAAGRAANRPTVSDSGNQVLTLSARGRPPAGTKGPVFPAALERTYLAVESPTVRLPAGSWVRVSFQAKILGIQPNAADGAMVSDTAGGEPLAIRLYDTFDLYTKPLQPMWKPYRFYRQVPPSGTLGLTFALTGTGVVAFDDVRIEPME